MPFKKGQSGNIKGRIAGKKKEALPAKRTNAAIEALIDDIIKKGAKKYRQEIMKLEKKQYTDTYDRLLEYRLPRMARTEVTGADGGPIQVAQVILIGDQELVF